MGLMYNQSSVDNLTRRRINLCPLVFKPEPLHFLWSVSELLLSSLPSSQ